MAARPREVDRSGDAKRRALILAAAEKLFRHYGPGKTTIGDIAAEAGIGVGSVYLEFCSKDDIVGELSRRRHDRVLAAMHEASLTGSYPERLAAALEARIRTLFALSAEGAHSCDLVLCSAAPVKSAYGRFRTEELELVRELLDAGAEAGELDVADAGATAELIQRAYATFSPPWLFEQSPKEALEKARRMSQLLLDGLAARTREPQSRTTGKGRRSRARANS